MDKASNLSQFLLKLINDILDMSKIESGKVVLEREQLDLLDIYNQIHEMFASTAEQKGIDFEIKMEDMEIRYVIGDVLRLMQILINFVSNANKYTDKGGNVSEIKEINRLQDDIKIQNGILSVPLSKNEFNTALYFLNVNTNYKVSKLIYITREYDKASIRMLANIMNVTIIVTNDDENNTYESSHNSQLCYHRCKHNFL